MVKKKNKFNWAKYENDEIRKLAVLLKSIIWHGNWANRIR
jgi:hypothetical protein